MADAAQVQKRRPEARALHDQTSLLVKVGSHSLVMRTRTFVSPVGKRESENAPFTLAGEPLRALLIRLEERKPKGRAVGIKS